VCVYISNIEYLASDLQGSA